MNSLVMAYLLSESDLTAIIDAILVVLLRPEFWSICPSFQAYLARNKR